MKPADAVDPKVCENLLADAARMHRAADLVVVRGENLQANLKSRFLQVAPECVLLEVPTHDAHPMMLQPGQFVEVYFKHDHERFGFDSDCRGPGRVAAAT
jgi:c-di-GMP-binding flagellar brake protein YcgR